MVIETFCFNIVGDTVPPRYLGIKKNKTKLISDWFMASTGAYTIIYQSQSWRVYTSLLIITFTTATTNYIFASRTSLFYLYACEKDLAKCIYAAGFDFAAILLANNCFCVSNQRSNYLKSINLITLMYPNDGWVEMLIFYLEENAADIWNFSLVHCRVWERRIMTRQPHRTIRCWCLITRAVDPRPGRSAHSTPPAVENKTMTTSTTGVRVSKNSPTCMGAEMIKTERFSPSKAPPTSPDLWRRPIMGLSLSLKNIPTYQSLGQLQRDLYYRERQRYSGPAFSFNYVFCFFLNKFLVFFF